MDCADAEQVQVWVMSREEDGESVLGEMSASTRGGRINHDKVESYIVPCLSQNLDYVGMEKAIVCFTIPYLYHNRATAELAGRHHDALPPLCTSVASSVRNFNLDRENASVARWEERKKEGRNWLYLLISTSASKRGHR